MKLERQNVRTCQRGIKCKWNFWKLKQVYKKINTNVSDYINSSMGIACSDVLYSEPGFLFHFRLLWLWHTLRNIEVIPSSLYFNRAQKFFHSRRKWLTGVQTKWQNPRTAQNRNEAWTPADYFFSRDVSTPYHPNQYHIFYVLKPGKLFLQNHLFKKKWSSYQASPFLFNSVQQLGELFEWLGWKTKKHRFYNAILEGETLIHQCMIWQCTICSQFW